jgi:hypothetical protein
LFIGGDSFLFVVIGEDEYRNEGGGAMLIAISGIYVAATTTTQHPFKEWQIE